MTTSQWQYRIAIRFQSRI